MPKFIPENILDDILSRVDIVELISGYLPLKRAGRNFKANCPFHHEKTPSFMVSADRQIYHCFGCGESGNAFKFLMRHERLEFREAVENLAKSAGVILPAEKEESDGISISSRLYEINALAVSFYEANLNSESGLRAKEYLIKRGLRSETIKLFKLGFAADKWDGLISHLRAKNINISLIEKAGLILPKEGGGYYDRFRNRVIFPIFDIKSRVIGFGARVLPDEETSQRVSAAKYVNSPETAVYIKGKNLYGFNFAKDAVRENDYAVIVEGYLDFIMPYQQGLKNIVASQGTALTVEQIRLLKRYTHNFVMIYDGDMAGQAATLRALDLLIEEDVFVKIVSLPDGIDPDQFVRKNGVNAISEKIGSAENVIDYKLRILKLRHNIKSIEGKTQIASEMLLTISKFNNAVMKSEYIRRLAVELDVKEDAVLEEMKKIKGTVKSSYTNKEETGKKTGITPTEKLLIKLMLEENEFIDYVKRHLAPLDFHNPAVSKIISTIFDLANDGRSINEAVLTGHLSDDSLMQSVCELAFMPEVSMDLRTKMLSDCIERLKSQKTKLQKQSLHEQIRSAQMLGDEKKLNDLMQEFDLLIKRGK